MKRTILFLVLVMGLTAPGVAADTIHVCPEGCDFSEVQAALDSAGEGDILKIGPGTYMENLVINKSVRLEGEDHDTAIIPFIEVVPTITITADGVTLEGIALANGSEAVSIFSVNDFSMTKCTLDGNYIGASIWSMKGATITGNTFKNFDRALEIDSSLGSSIMDNLFEEGIDAVSLSGSRNIVISGNEFINIERGARLDTSDDNSIHRNRFLPGDEFAAFLDIYFSSSNSIFDNEVGAPGIYARDRLSISNIYALEGINLTGQNFELSQVDPGAMDGTVFLARGISLNLSAEGWARLEAERYLDAEEGLNISTVGFYAGHGDDMKLLAPGTLEDGLVKVSVMLEESGAFFLMGAKEKGAAEVPEAREGKTRSIWVAVLILILLAGGVAAYYWKITARKG